MVPLLSSFISKKAIIFAVVLLLLIGVYIKGRYDGANLLEAQYTQEKLEWQSKISSMQKEFDDAVLKNMEDYLAESSKTKKLYDMLNQNLRLSLNMCPKILIVNAKFQTLL